MAENDCEEQVIGVSFDGTGYGTDGTIWGGEILLADYQGFTRFGSIEPFLQMGGDVSCKRRMANCRFMIYGYTGDRRKGMETCPKNWDFAENRKQSTVDHGRPEDQCGDFNQCRTAV